MLIVPEVPIARTTPARFALAHQRADRAFEMRFELAQLRARRRIVGQEALGQARRAELDAAHPQRLAVVHQHQLDAAAADVDQQMRPAVEAERVTRGVEDQARLVGAGDHFDGEAGLALDAADELRAIACLAHRAGRDGAQSVHAAHSQQAA